MKTFPLANARARRANPPELPASRRQRPLDDRSTHSPGRGKGAETVLVVDDERMLRGALSTVLRQFGYHVLEAFDTLDAQRLAESGQKIHLVLVDLYRAEFSNLQLALWFRAIHPEIKVLVASSSVWDVTCELGASQQIAVLPKPFTPIELADMVRRVLESDDGLEQCVPAREHANSA